MINEFIKSELENYIEPERRGVSKGDVVGFGKNKLHACIRTAITNADLKWNAEEANAKYGSLRIWRTEENFIKKEKEFQGKFVNLFISKFNAYLENAKEKNPDEKKWKELVETMSNLNTDVRNQIVRAVPEVNLGYLNTIIKSAERSKSDEVRLPKNGFRKMIRILEEGKDPLEKNLVISILKSSTGV